MDKESRFWLFLWIAVLTAAVIVAGVVVYGVTVAGQQYNSRVAACVNSGGTWSQSNSYARVPEKCTVK